MKYCHLGHMNRSWDYHAKWNKSDRKCWEPYDFTHMQHITLKATNETNEQDKQRLMDTDNSSVVTKGKRRGEVDKGKNG